jgi:ATP-binding cassette subfamily B protein
LLPYKRELLFGSIGAVLVTLLNLVPAFLSGRIIDDVVKPFRSGALEQDRALEMGLVMVASLALAYGFRELFMWVRLKKMSVLGEKVAKDLRKELYEHLQSLDLEFFSKKQTGSIISRVSSDSDRIWDFIAFGVVEVSISVLMLAGLSSMLIYLDWRLGLLMTVPVPIFLVAIYFHGERMKRMFLKAWRKWSGLTNVLSDTIPGIQVVKAFNQEEREKDRFNTNNDTVTKEFNNIHNAWTGFWPKLMGGIHLVMISVWFFALPRLVDQHQPLSSGTFVSFLLYMTMFSAPIEVIGQVARMLNRALSSAHRIFEILDSRASVVDKEEPKKLMNLKGEITFKDVYFSYDGVRPVLKGMNFSVKPGEMIGLVGKSGGGKSTITKLISRFYDVSSGSILVDGIDIKELDSGLYRKQVGMVLQEPYLFHGTIWENISYGVQGAELEKIVEAAKIANAHDFIMSLPHGYDTVVGERGHDLSGGERQRISIARAVLADPKILILDEATSAVDTETERNIQEALDRLSKGRTVFAVAHRLSTLRKADRIFVVGKGKIVEEGTHDHLLSDENGEYRKLHEMQKEMSEAFAL